MPESVEIDEKTATDRYAKFTAEPFQAGFGHSIGNSLRRILLSSLEGIAISAVRIEGVPHEFATVKDVQEDVTEIILNLKKITLTADDEAKIPKTLEIKAEKAGPVKASDIEISGAVKIVNPDQLICTLDKDTEFYAEIELSRGRGYRDAEKNKKEDHPIGTIPIDCLFSPVTRVRYDVGAARVGEETEMDSLHIEIWSDGRIDPVSALEKSSKIFKEHLRPFLGSEAGEEDALSAMSEEDRKLYKTLSLNVDHLDLSVRAINCLANAEINIIGELCMKSENIMLRYRNFGKKSLDEIKEKLDEMNLELGMTFSDELREAVLAEAERQEKEKEKDGEDEE